MCLKQMQLLVWKNPISQSNWWLEWRYYVEERDKRERSTHATVKYCKIMIVVSLYLNGKKTNFISKTCFFSYPLHNRISSNNYLRLVIVPPSKTKNNKVFLSSSLAKLWALNKASFFRPSPLSRGSSAGALRERSISTCVSLIHWARKNCRAN